MSRPTPTPDRPLTAGTVRRLLAALAVGALIVAATSFALTEGLGTPTAGIFAAVAAAFTFAGSAFEFVEYRAARRAAMDRADEVPVLVPIPPRIVDPAKASARLALYADAATIAVDAGITPVLERWLDEEMRPREVAAAAVSALLGEVDLLDNLAEWAVAIDEADQARRAAEAAAEPAVDAGAPA